MKNEEIKKAFDFELENTNEPLYSDEILKFVKNFHKKTKIEKEKFINSYQNNILDVISEIDFAFNDLLSNCKDAENRLYTIEELTPKNIKKREKLIKEIELLNNSKTQWNNDLKYFIKIGIQETKELDAKSNTKKDKTEENWFIVGVKFATGEMQNLLKNDNPTQIARNLGNVEGFRPYISQTNGIIKDKNKPDDKNIYKRKKSDINLILEYCKSNNLEVCQDFKDKIKHIIFD